MWSNFDIITVIWKRSVTSSNFISVSIRNLVIQVTDFQGDYVDLSPLSLVHPSDWMRIQYFNQFSPFYSFNVSYFYLKISDQRSPFLNHWWSMCCGTPKATTCIPNWLTVWSVSRQYPYGQGLSIWKKKISVILAYCYIY